MLRGKRSPTRVIERDGGDIIPGGGEDKITAGRGGLQSDPGPGHCWLQELSGPASDPEICQA